MPLLPTFRTQPKAAVEEEAEGGNGLKEKYTAIYNVLAANGAFDAPRAVGHEDLRAIGFGPDQPGERLMALRLLSTASRDAQRFSRRDWAGDLVWEGQRRPTVTLCSYFPLCICYFVFRVLMENTEDYVLTPHALILTSKHPVLACTRKTIIYLRTVQSIDLVEKDNFTGTSAVAICGRSFKYMKSETILLIRTENGVKASIRLSREKADESIETLLTLVRSARAIKSAAEMATSRLAGTKLSAHQHPPLGRRRGHRRTYCDLLEEAVSDRRSTSYWMKQLLLEFVETGMMCLAVVLIPKSTDNNQNDRDTAVRLVIGASVVNFVSLVPLLNLISMYKLQKALENMNKSRTGNEMPLPPDYESLLHLSRASYVVLDILSDYLQFVASLYIILAGGTDSQFERAVSIITLVAMATASLEVHTEVKNWVGAVSCAGGNCCWLISRGATIGFLLVGILYYSEFMTTDIREEKRLLAKNFALICGLLLFLYIGTFVMLAGTERWCMKLCGCVSMQVYDRRFAEGRARQTTGGKVRFAKKDERGTWLFFSQVVDAFTKI